MKKISPKRQKSRAADGRAALHRSSRPPLIRMVRIHELLRKEQFPNCQKMSEELEVAAKTVQRDIDFMRDQMELPIEYDAVRHGFYYSKPVANFPMMTVTQGEVVALLVAQKAIDQYRGTAFEKPLESAFSKLASSMREETGVSLHDLSEAFSFRPTGVAQPELRVFRGITDAVMQSVEIEFDYRPLQAKHAQVRRVHPYHLGCINNVWYLFAFDLEREGIRTFALTRISKVVATKKTFRRPAEFSMEKMLRGSFAAFETGKVEEVVVELDDFATQLAAERKWHPSQKLEAREDGSGVLTLNVGIAPDLENWLLSLGAHARVVAPPKLREKLAAIAEAMAANYKNEDRETRKSG